MKTTTHFDEGKITATGLLKEFDICEHAWKLIQRCHACQDYKGTPTFEKCSKCMIQHDMVRVYKIIDKSLQ